MKRIGCLGLVVLSVVAFAVLVWAAGDFRGEGGEFSGRVGLEDMRFVPNRIDAKVGVPLRVQLINRGTERHDLNFQSLHMPGLEGVEAILEPGETRTITLTFDQAGTHTFICTLPGHAAAGMTGAAFVSQ
ncbi:MAG: cupredoxin domain-containing protein [Chloroflexota bacterium]